RHFAGRSFQAAGIASAAMIAVGVLSPLDVAAIDARVLARAAGLAEDSPYLVHPAGFWLHLVGQLEPSAAGLPEAPRNTLDAPVLELGLARGGAGLLDGERLLPFLERVQAAGPGALLAGLDGEHRTWWREGQELFRASALADRGHEEEARALAFGVLGRLPGALRESLFPSSDDGPR
ncbi:MAG: hypothetical protein ABL998_10825, partial [Planctomycetota bacterium]